MTQFTVHWHQSITEISELQWKRITGENQIPFFEWKWLEALERSVSVSAQEGWQPLHLALWKNKSPVAIAPLYLKGHSYGEFVFDQAFAQLAIDLGLNYYPKLIGMSPFSPIEGYKFLISANEDKKEITSILMSEIDKFAIRNGILSCNFLYSDPSWHKEAESYGCARWINQQSLWHANGKSDFSEYLNTFNSNQKRNIKRERNSIRNSGINISILRGSDITISTMDRMYQFYENHCSKWGIWGSKYLKQSFFQELSFNNHNNSIVIFNAYKNDPLEPLAMSLCITNGKKLWGRYWGCNEEINYLHFELCYYSPIQWALEQGIESFDPGAGGQHKRRRGFISKPHSSFHRWYDKRMDRILRSWLPQYNSHVIKEIEAANNELPFKSVIPPLTF